MDLTYEEYINFINDLLMQEFTDNEYHMFSDVKIIGSSDSLLIL